MEGDGKPARSSSMGDERAMRPADDDPEGPPLVAEPLEAEKPVTVGELLDGARAAASDVKGAALDLAASARRVFDAGRYRKVRISRKGKPVLPDIPLAAAVAAEAASVVGGGVARVLAANLGAKLLFDVELVNEADKYVKKAQEALLDGNLERAREALSTALRMDDRHPGAELQTGVLARLEGDLSRARRHLARAVALDPLGETGKRASAILAGLDGG